MNKKLIDLYKEWMETGKLPERGLCPSLPFEYKDAFRLLTPEYSEWSWWANSGSPQDVGMDEWERAFNPIRQTIVLLICCIHEEY